MLTMELLSLFLGTGVTILPQTFAVTVTGTNGGTGGMGGDGGVGGNRGTTTNTGTINGGVNLNGASSNGTPGG
jgi:hypothetical protein